MIYASKQIKFDTRLFRVWRILDDVELEMIKVAALTVIILSFPAGFDTSLDTVEVKWPSFFVKPENSFAGRHLFPFIQKSVRKRIIRDTYLTTPLRQNQRRHLDNPAATLVSTTQPPSSPKNSEMCVSEPAIGGFSRSA